MLRHIFVECPRVSYVLCSMFYVLCSMFYVLCSMFYVLCPMFNVLCSMSYVLCSMFFVQCSMSYVLCSMFYVQCSMFYVLCSARRTTLDDHLLRRTNESNRLQSANSSKCQLFKVPKCVVKIECHVPLSMNVSCEEKRWRGGGGEGI